MYRNIYHYRVRHLTNQIVIGSNQYSTRDSALRHVLNVPYDRALYIKTVEMPDGLLLPEWIHQLPIRRFSNTKRVIPL